MLYVIWQLLELVFMGIVLMLWMTWLGLRLLFWMIVSGIATVWDWWHARHPD